MPNLCVSACGAKLERPQTGFGGAPTPNRIFFFPVFLPLVQSFSASLPFQFLNTLTNFSLPYWLIQVFHRPLPLFPPKHLASLLKLDSIKHHPHQQKEVSYFSLMAIQKVVFFFLFWFFGVKAFACIETAEKYCKLKSSCENKIIPNP